MENVFFERGDINIEIEKKLQMKLVKACYINDLIFMKSIAFCDMIFFPNDEQLIVKFQVKQSIIYL